MRANRIRAALAILLCAILIGNSIYVARDHVAAAELHVSDDKQASHLSELDVPAGGLRTPNAVQVDEEQAAKVPSYEKALRASRLQTIFQKGTGTYGFDSLSAEQQNFYLSLETSLANFDRIDAAEAEFESINYGDGTVQYTPFKVDFSKAGIDIDQAIRAWVAFRADHPWLFWLGGIAYSNSQLMPVVESTYESDIRGVREMYTTIESAVTEYLGEAQQADGIYEKVRVIYNHLIKTIDYAYKSDGSTPESEDWAHSVVGVFDSAHNKAVCEGYAKAFSFILNILDVPNVYIVGQAGGGGHAWNAVSFDGGKMYYYMDATWDDPKGAARNQYAFFAMPKNIFEKRHTPDSTAGSGFSWQYGMPSLGSSMDYTYYVRYAAYGTAEEIGDVGSAKTFLKKAKILSPEGKCMLLLSDKNVLQNVAQALELSGYTYSSQQDYGMLLFEDTADLYGAQTPAAAFSLSETKIAVGEEDREEQIITISSATERSDDYITFYSSNERVADVITPYVKAEPGEEVHIAIRGTGTATIYAKSSAGKATTSCEVTVGEAVPDETPTAKPEEKPTAEPGENPTAKPGEAPTIKPGEEPTAEPEEKPTAEPGENPTVKPGEDPTEKPGETPTMRPGENPTEKPGDTPTIKPGESPTEKPGDTPTIGPGESPTEKPGDTSTTEPADSSTEKPGDTSTEMPGGTPAVNQGGSSAAATQPPSGSGSVQEVRKMKKGDIFTAGNLKYKVTKVNGKAGQLSVIGVKSKKAVSIVIPKKVNKNGVSFTITSIQANAFKGCKKVKKLSIKSTGLKKVTKKSFNGLSRKLKISLPKSKAAQYRKMLKKCNYFIK